MSKTKRPTVDQIILAESPYQRAAAIYVARRLNIDPDEVYGVDFTMEYLEGCETCGPETWSGLGYSLRNPGNRSYPQILDLKYNSAGAFIEECVEIMKETNNGRLGI